MKRQGDHSREDIFISLGNNIPWGFTVFRFIFTSEIIPKDIGGSFFKGVRTRREGFNAGDTMYLPISNFPEKISLDILYIIFQYTHQRGGG